jgi:hypothetical protein
MAANVPVVLSAIAAILAVIVGWALKVPVVLLVLIFVTIVVLAVLFPRTVKFLGTGEQLKVERFTENVMHNGPGVVLLNPVGYRQAKVVPATSLGEMDYVKVKDEVGGKERIERGPKMLFLGAYESITTRGQATTLSQTEYVIVEDRLTGKCAMKKGPDVWFPGPYDQLVNGRSRLTATALQEDEFVRIQDNATGNRWVQKGKDLLFLQPTWKVESGVSKAWTLKAFEYVRLLDNVTGKVTVHRGESTVFPGPNEELLDGDTMSAIDLKANEYVKVQDQTNGDIRVVSGVALVFLGPSEKVIDGGKRQAIEVDDEHAVLIRESKTGQLRLVTENQLFVPGPTENIEKVQKLYRLSDHEAMIVKDKDGTFHFHYGDPKKQSGGKARSFFLPPYAEIVKLWWSSGLRRAKRDLGIERFDLRPNFMWNEIDCRTLDNVELVLECTMYYEVVDLATMVRTTGNLPGDIYNQIRSQFIKQVARVTLKKFMEELHLISKGIFEDDPGFYAKRGVKIHSLEVTKYACSEKRTSEVLQQIIEETTNRLNRLSKAESENEVNIYKMQGQIQEQQLNGQLLEIQQEHTKSEAAVAGVAEAERLRAFMEGIKEEVPKLEDRIAMWQTLRKKDALSVVAEGGANLYYTPEGVDLSIKS